MVGAPGLTQMGARRALNVAYHLVVSNMDADQRLKFDEQIRLPPAVVAALSGARAAAAQKEAARERAAQVARFAALMDD